MAKVLLKGNEALAEAALAAGCRFYSGYPITPQTEILEYLSWRMEDVGGTFIQAESELAGINMVLGAAAAGARALTTSSGPGFSLKQEGISYLVAADRYRTGSGRLLAAYQRRRPRRLPHTGSCAGIRSGKCRYDGRSI